ARFTQWAARIAECGHGACRGFTTTAGVHSTGRITGTCKGSAGARMARFTGSGGQAARAVRRAGCGRSDLRGIDGASERAGPVDSRRRIRQAIGAASAYRTAHGAAAAITDPPDDSRGYDGIRERARQCDAGISTRTPAARFAEDDQRENRYSGDAGA